MIKLKNMDHKALFSKLVERLPPTDKLNILADFIETVAFSVFRDRVRGKFFQSCHYLRRHEGTEWWHCPKCKQRFDGQLRITAKGASVTSSQSQAGPSTSNAAAAAGAIEKDGDGKLPTGPMTSLTYKVLDSFDDTTKKGPMPKIFREGLVDALLQEVNNAPKPYKRVLQSTFAILLRICVNHRGRHGPGCFPKVKSEYNFRQDVKRNGFLAKPLEITSKPAVPKTKASTNSKSKTSEDPTQKSHSKRSFFGHRLIKDKETRPHVIPLRIVDANFKFSDPRIEKINEENKKSRDPRIRKRVLWEYSLCYLQNVANSYGVSNK